MAAEAIGKSQKTKNLKSRAKNLKKRNKIGRKKRKKNGSRKNM